MSKYGRGYFNLVPISPSVKLHIGLYRGWLDLFQVRLEAAPEKKQREDCNSLIGRKGVLSCIRSSMREGVFLFEPSNLTIYVIISFKTPSLV